MHKRMMIIMALPIALFANPWLISGGIGFGQHHSNHSVDESLYSTQSQWHLLAHISSALYEGMDGRLSYEFTQGSYENVTLLDNNLSIDFRAHMIHSNLRIGSGFGLGFNNRNNTSLDQILNQAFVPFYLNIKTVTGPLNPWQISIQSDYFVHPPNDDFLNGFNPLLTRLKIGIHYYYKQFEYNINYQNARFSNDYGIHGINTDRIQGQIIYHWHPFH